MTITAFYLWQESFYWCCNNDHLWIPAMIIAILLHQRITIYFLQNNKLEIVISKASNTCLPLGSQKCVKLPDKLHSHFLKSFSTQVASHPSVNQAQGCLTFLIDTSYSCNQAILCTALRLLGSFLRAILKAEWSPIILSRGFENFFHTFSFVQNNKTILITLKCFV